MVNVSICTPTYNRREHIKNLISYIENQTYTDYEWLIYDDGDDKIYDLVKDIPYVRYFESRKKSIIEPSSFKLIRGTA